jgi:predicted PurR-regulated permease PerM
MRKPYTFDRVVRILIGIAVLLFIFLVIQRLSNVLLPFLISWLIAYILQPVVKFFQSKLMMRNRALAVGLTLLIFVGVILGALFILIPMIVEELGTLSKLTVQYAQKIDTNSFIPQQWRNAVVNYLSGLDVDTVIHDDNFIATLKSLAPQLLNIVDSSISFVMGFAVVVVMFIYLIFMMLDFENLSKGIFNIVPHKYRPLVGGIISDLEAGMNRYFRGQALVATIVGTLFVIGFSIISLPLAVVLGIMIGILDLIPYFKIIGVIPVVTIGVLHSAESNKTVSTVLISILAVFVVIQLIEDLVLVPRIMGKVTGLNPAVILLSLSIWSTLMGVSGLIIALPVTTLMISYYKRYVLKENEHSPESETEKVE